MGIEVRGGAENIGEVGVVKEFRKSIDDLGLLVSRHSVEAQEGAKGKFNSDLAEGVGEPGALEEVVRTVEDTVVHRVGRVGTVSAVGGVGGRDFVKDVVVHGVPNTSAVNCALDVAGSAKGGEDRA